MTEIPIGTTRTINRRKFLAAASTVTAVALGVHELDHEKNLVEKGMFETPDALWHPIYERHDQHEQVLTPNNIPPQLKALSLEGVSTTFMPSDDGKMKKYNDLQVSVASLFGGDITGHDTTPPSVHSRIPTQTLEYLKQNHILVAFGDTAVDSGDFDSIRQVNAALDLREKIGQQLMQAGVATAAAGQGLKVAKIDRRGLLRLGGLTAAAMGAGKYLPAKYRRELHKKLMDAMKDNDPYVRVWSRLQTISSDLLPEYLNDLLRELLQANKLMTLAKELKSTTQDKKPVIGYNWHLAHRGIEDWLRIGQEITRACILAYPDEVFRQVVAANNDDPRCLYAIRLTQVPQSLEIIPVGKAQMTKFDPTEVVEDRIVEDGKLAGSLRLRGPLDTHVPSL